MPHFVQKCPILRIRVGRSSQAREEVHTGVVASFSVSQDEAKSGENLTPALSAGLLLANLGYAFKGFIA